MAKTKYKSKTWLKNYLDDETKKRFQDENIRSEGLKMRDSKDESLKAGISKLNEKYDYFKAGKDEPDPAGEPIGQVVGPPTMSEYYKQVNEDFLTNQKHPFYKEALSRYGMPDFTKTIPMNTEDKPLNLMVQVKTTDGKEMVDTLNPLFLKLGIVDVKKKVYQYKTTDSQKRCSSGGDVGGYSIITTPREYNIIGENKDNYYYMKDGVLVSLGKIDVSEKKPDSQELEALWKQSISDIIGTVRGTTAADERALEEELKVYGNGHIEEDIAILEKNGINYDGLSLAGIRKTADVEREKERPWLQRIGEAEGFGETLSELTSPMSGKFSQRVSEAIPQAASGLGLPEEQPDINPVMNFLSDMVGYGTGLAMPTGGGTQSIGSAAYSLGEKATVKAGPKIGAKLGSAVQKYFKSPNAYKVLESPIAQSAGREALKGAAGAPLVTAYETAAQELGPGEALKKGVLEAAIGGAGGAVLGGIGGKLAQRAEAKTLKARTKETGPLTGKTGEKVKKIVEKAEEKKKKIESSKYGKEEYKKKYKLDEELKGTKEEKAKVSKERVEKVISDTGRKVKEKVGSDNPKEIFKHYKNKYKKELENVKLQAALKAEGVYEKVSRAKNGDIIIKYNPKKSPDIAAGSIRHGIEHVLDVKKGFKGVDRTINKAAKNVYEQYASKTHHKFYEFFEPEYVRRQDVKNALNAGETVPPDIIKELSLENYKPVRAEGVPPGSIPPVGGVSTTGIKGISRFRGTTVPESQATTEAFKKNLKRRPPVEYDIRSNQQDWDNAVDKVFKNPENTWTAIKNRTQKGYNAADSTEMMALIEMHEHNKNYDGANEVLEHLTEKATEAGQFIQALSIWNRRTPEGMLKYAKYKANKGMAKKFPARDQLKGQIKTLKNTIKELEGKKNNASNKEIKGIEDDINLHSRNLAEIEDKLAKLEKKISKLDLSEEDSKYITDRMKNYKSEAFRQKYYDEKLQELTKGSPASEKQQFKASEYATRKQNIELKRALTKISELEPTTNRDRLRALQRINLLTNAKTMIRNNVSNSVFGLVEVTREQTFGAAIDYLAAAARTKSVVKPITRPLASGRTTVFSPIQMPKAYVEGLGKGMKAVYDDVYDSLKVYHEHINTSNTRGPFESVRGKTFKGKNVVSRTLNKMDNIVKTIVTDRPFYEAAKEARISQLKKIGKTSTITPEMEDAAALYAVDKVFQNDSYIARTMTAFRKKAPYLGDIIMPFTQTPGNVLDKLLDYTPVSLGKLLHQFGTKGEKGFDTKLAVDRMSRMLSGAGIAVMAYALAKKGLITGNLYAEPSKKKREFELAKGKKSYALKIGNKYYTYDWLTPVGGVFSAVADWVGTQKSESGSKALEVMIGSPINTVANQSFLSGVFALFSEQTISEGLIKGVGGSLSQAVPLSTLTRQIATFTDPLDRDASGTSQGEKIKKRAVKGIPGLRQKLDPKADIFGEELKTGTENRGLDFFNTFVMPANIGTEKRTRITDELDRLIKANPREKATNILPSSISNTIRYKNEDFELTSVQAAKFKKIYGKEVASGLNQTILSSEYRSLTNANKFKAIKGIYTTALKESKKKALKSFGYGVEEE